jgi:kinesin family protein C1
LECERDALKESLSSQKSSNDQEAAEEISKLKGEVELLREKLKNAEMRTAAFGEKSAEDVKELEEQLTLMKTERRKMFNVIQELRGNVRVFARVRPYLPNDQSEADAVPVVTPLDEFRLAVSGSKSEHKFGFDKVFAPSTGQEQVFTEVSEFVQSALDGYNVCLFSYGQTGSGKTHTMQGSGTGAMRGIIPRAIQQVGNYKSELEKDGWEYHMQVSFLEIYNETIRDLLREESGVMGKHDVKVDANGRRFVSDLTMQDLDPNDDKSIEDVMRQAAKHRSVACTDMNAVSSRSHSVFTLHLTATHKQLKQCLRGKLNLVDLAGSERLERSGATGERAKEAMNINKSLSSLTDVFTAIGNKASHIPYRNSKLTYLLQPCLSGEGKTLMLVNLSPTAESLQETVCSLRFAAAVNKCELGKAKKSAEDFDENNGGGGGGGDGSSSSSGAPKEAVPARGRKLGTSSAQLSKSMGRSRSSPSKMPK